VTCPPTSLEVISPSTGSQLKWVTCGAHQRDPPSIRHGRRRYHPQDVGGRSRSESVDGDILLGGCGQRPPRGQQCGCAIGYRGTTRTEDYKGFASHDGDVTVAIPGTTNATVSWQPGGRLRGHVPRHDHEQTKASGSASRWERKRQARDGIVRGHVTLTKGYASDEAPTSRRHLPLRGRIGSLLRSPASRFPRCPGCHAAAGVRA